MPRNVAEPQHDTISWLLEDSEPAVRHATLRDLLGRSADDPEVVAAREEAMRSEPIATILAHQSPEGYWEKAGAGYSPKYRSTVWQIIFLDQLGADGADERVRRGIEYLLDHTQTAAGGFGCSSDASPRPPASSTALHCLHGNLLRALLGFGLAADPRVQRAIEWTATSVADESRRKDYTPGPDFACAFSGGRPCAWGAIKELLALARVPATSRTPTVEAAIERGVEFLLSRDLTDADYPTGDGSAKVSPHWFRLGFPYGYPADVLQALEALVGCGRGGDPRLRPAFDWLASRVGSDGRWRNELSYGNRAWAPFERRRAPSKWVTLRALRVLRAVEAPAVE